MPSHSAENQNHSISTSRICTLSLLLGLGAGISSCNFWSCEEGVGSVGERELELNPASELEISIAAQVSYWVDENRSNSLVVLKAEENLLDLIEVNSKDGELKIESEGCLDSEEGIRIDIITPRLEEVTLEGAVSFFGMNQVLAKELELSINGSGQIEMNALAEELDCEISGTGDILLKGKAQDLDIKINGTGNVSAFDMNTLSPSSTLKVRSRKSLFFTR